MLVSECVLWRYLEDLPGQAAPLVEWHQHLDGWPGFQDFHRRYLQLTKDPATAVECRTDCGLGCPRKVVTHAPNDIVAVCPEQEEKPYPLKRQDILIYSVKRASLHKDICSALGITHRESKVDGCRRTWRLGDFVPTAGMIFPVFLTHQEDQDELLEVAKTLCLLHADPFVLLTLTRRRLSPPTEQMLAQRNAIFLALEEEMPFDEQGGLQVRRTPDELFAPLHEEVPEPGSGGMVHFPTPDGTRWSDIKIQFRNGHTVTIWAGGQSGRYTYYQMGMYSKKNGDQTKQWTLLLDFAENRGEIDKNSRKETPYHLLKKRKQELSKCLREFFRLKEDPIEWIKDEKCYRCHFTILPEGVDDFTFIREEGLYE